jgi:phage tail-like protein
VTRERDWLVRQLPVGMMESDDQLGGDAFLVRFVRIVQEVADTIFHQVDNVPHLFDVAVAPDVMVRTIGSWLGLDWVDPSRPEALQRSIVREYSLCVPWRGTRVGLTRLLELICGKPVTIRDSGGIYAYGQVPERPPHVQIDVPVSSWAEDDDLIRIVKAELPASVTFELSVGGRTIHPPVSTTEPILAGAM